MGNLEVFYFSLRKQKVLGRQILFIAKHYVFFKFLFQIQQQYQQKKYMSSLNQQNGEESEPTDDSLQEFSMLNTIVLQLQKNNIYKVALAQAHLKYRLSPFKIRNLTPTEVRTIYLKLHEKVYDKKKSNQNSHSWSDNELRIFLWTATGLAYLRNMEIQNFGKKQIIGLCDLFGGKDEFLVQFQLKLLQKSEKKGQRWSQQEDSLLSQFVKSTSSVNKWNRISKQIYSHSNKELFRTPKQCRQRWMNHLNPNIKKEQWSLEEDIQLFQKFLINGKKWAIIARLMDGNRTQHSVKNRFNSLMKPFLDREDDPEQKKVAYKVLSRFKKTVLKNKKIPTVQINKPGMVEPTVKIFQKQMDFENEDLDCGKEEEQIFNKDKGNYDFFIRDQEEGMRESLSFISLEGNHQILSQDLLNRFF